MPQASAVEVALAAQNNLGRPPFVRFELRSVEDRNASIEQGHFVGKDVPFALITPRGSKDVHEERAEEWLDKMAQEVKEERMPSAWFEEWKLKFERWMKGEHALVDGTPLREWPPIRPALLRTCHEMGIYSVEDLAGSNEEAVASLGMGGRSLRQVAINWLSAARNLGIPTAKLAALESDNASLRVRTESQDQQIRELLSRISAIEANNAASVTLSPTQQANNESSRITSSDLFDEPSPKPVVKHATPKKL